MNLFTPTLRSLRFSRFPVVPATVLISAVWMVVACLVAPVARAQPAPAAAAAPTEQVSVFPTIPDVVVKQFAFGVFHNLDTPAAGLDPTLEVTRNNTPIGWVLKLDATNPTVRWREEFSTPVPPQKWGMESDRADIRPPILSADKRTVTTERSVSTTGDIWHYWTLEPNDPAGPHIMRVWVNDVLVATVNFVVK
jgi:hypothetical protein